MFRFCTLIPILLLTSGLAPAQEPQLRIFPVKYANVAELAHVLDAFHVSINADRELKVLAVRGPAETLDVIGEAIKRLDVPPAPVKDIELMAYILVAGPQPAGAGGVPRDLDPVVKQLKSVFNYQGFRLLDTLIIRDRPNEAGSVSGTLPGAMNGAGEPSPYSFDIQSASIAGEGTERVIRINSLRLNVKVPRKNGSMIDVGLRTNLDVREGQKVVVGKSNIDSSDMAMILVLTAKVLE